MTGFRFGRNGFSGKTWFHNLRAPETLQSLAPHKRSRQFDFEIPQSGFVSLKVLDVLGREVATLVNEEKSPSSYSARWNATNVGSGTYFARLESNGKRQMTKMLLMR